MMDNYELFIKKILQKLHKLKIDVAMLEMDHIGYQASSNKDYDRLKQECEAMGTMALEAGVGGRRVGMYR